jgi:hypothetical protein
MTIPSPPDHSHASAHAARFFDSYFAAKSEHSLDRWMDHFDPHNTIYADATLGWLYPHRSALRDAVAQFIPNWGTGISYATRILGDEHSAVIAVTDTPELFGNEIRTLSAVDMLAGKIIRFVDYWDGRHFGADAVAKLRAPDDEFPASLGAETAPGTTNAAIREASNALNDAFGANDANRAAARFTDDAVFEDLTLRTQIQGRLAIARYLRRTNRNLPYAQSASVIHVLGDDMGGGYEWKSASKTVRSGLIALELDARGQISRLSAIWDGARVDDATYLSLIAQAAELSTSR